MFTGIVEEKGTIRYIQLTGESGVLAVKEQSWKQQGRKQSKSGACDSCRWQIRRTYRKRPY